MLFDNLFDTLGIAPTAFVLVGVLTVAALPAIASLFQALARDRPAGRPAPPPCEQTKGWPFDRMLALRGPRKSR